MEPFLRWAGGKRWLAKELAPLLNSRLVGNYFEPFLGSGAMFFALQPAYGALSDINAELIDTYRAVAAEPKRLTRRLQQLKVDSDTYYKIRDWEPNTLHDRALRFIYLNRTCYGGLYRTNRQGKFNVPFGGGSRTPEVLWKKQLLEQASEFLRQPGIELRASDFGAVICEAGDGDVVYCDPVYTTATFEQFDRYNPKVFRWTEQERLRDAAYSAYERGALVVLSNVHATDVKRAYPDAFRIKLERKKSIGNAAKAHKSGHEYLVILDPQSRWQDWKKLGSIERQFPIQCSASSKQRIGTAEFYSPMITLHTKSA